MGKLKNFVVPAKNKILCLMGTEAGRIVKEELGVQKGCAVNHEHMEAWVLDATNQVRDRETNLRVQVICERSVAPLPISGISNVKITKTVINQINKETVSATLVKLERDAVKNRFVFGVIILVGMPILGVLLMVAFNMWQQRGL